MSNDLGKIASLAKKVEEKKQQKITNGEVVEHDGKEYKLPSDYFLKGSILKKEVVKGKEEKQEIIEVFVCRQLPLITKMYVNIEENEKYYELEWVDNKRHYKQTVRASELSTRRELLKLSDSSLAVTDQNAAELIRYFDLFIMVNDIESQRLVTRLGMTKANEFIHPLNTDVKIQPPDVGEKQFIRAFEAKGSSDEWIENVLGLVKQHPKAMLMILGSFSSVILKDLKLSPFILDMASTTSQGKTTILRACASVWGNEHLMSEWNMTKVSAERKASFLNSFPLIADDSRKADDHLIQKFVYNFSGGRSKGRATVVGSQKEVTWENILLSTGEVSLVDFAKSAGGVSARVLPIKGRPFKNPDYEFFNSLYGAIENYYGQIGLDFLRFWQQSKKDEIPLYESYSETFQKKANGNEVISRIARHYSALVFVADLLNRHFNAAIDLDMLHQEFDEINQNNEANDKPMELLKDLLEHLDINRSNLEGDYMAVGETWGIYQHEKLHLTPKFVERFLGIEAKMTRAEWLRRGISIRHELNGKPVDTKQLKYLSKNRKVIELNMEIVKELGFDFSETVKR